MKKSTLFILIFSLIFAVGCKKEIKKEEGITKAMTAKKVKLKLDAKSESTVIGTVALTEEDNGDNKKNADFEQIREKVADIVAEDPRKAASLVKRWMTSE